MKETARNEDITTFLRQVLIATRSRNASSFPFCWPIKDSSRAKRFMDEELLCLSRTMKTFLPPTIDSSVSEKGRMVGWRGLVAEAKYKHISWEVECDAMFHDKIDEWHNSFLL